MALIRDDLSLTKRNNAWVWLLLPDPVPEGSVLYWLLINAFLDNLGLVSFSFSALLGLVSQNGIFLSDKIRIVSL